MHSITEGFINAVLNNGSETETATVYKNGQVFATYSKGIAIEVAKDIKGVAIDDKTGEVLKG